MKVSTAENCFDCMSIRTVVCVGSCLRLYLKHCCNLIEAFFFLTPLIATTLSKSIFFHYLC